jgi:hypothetical protein
MTIDLPADAFAEHLMHCTQGCDVALDGTGPVCDAGQAALDGVDWVARDAALTEATAQERARVVRDVVAGAQAGRRNAEARRGTQP